MADNDPALYSLRYNQAASTLEAFGGGSPQWTEVTLNNVDPQQVPVTRLINTTAPLVGGGNLTADRTLSIPAATGSVSGYLLAADWTTFNNKLTSTLASANIFVGNGSNMAIGVAMSGDATLSNAGALSLASVNANVGTFTYATITVNAKGLITAASSGTAPVVSVSGTANQITSTGGPAPTLALANPLTIPGVVTLQSLLVGNAALNAGENSASSNAYVSLSRSDNSWKIANETVLRIYEASGYSTNPTTNKFLEMSTGGGVTLYGNLSFNATSTQGIVGTATNDSAASGNVGEYIASTATAISFPASTQWGDITSISLTAGDWDVALVIYAHLNGAVGLTEIRFGVGTATGNDASGLSPGDTYFNCWLPTATTDSGTSIPAVRRTLTGTTTVYGKMYAAYSSGGPPQIYARLSARRVR